MPKTILLIGAAGSGKTWAMKQFIDIPVTYTVKCGKVKGAYSVEQNLFVAGIYDGSMYEGGDRLSMSVMTDYPRLRHWQVDGDVTILCEGDRFMNKSFIDMFEPVIIKITDDGSRGRKHRGSEQTPRHLKAIATRVSNVKADHEVYNSSMAAYKIRELL